MIELVKDKAKKKMRMRENDESDALNGKTERRVGIC